ncbi:MAG: alpha/beta hydrolase [Candidatus Omnitrophica bacterium]|nr:alpha/beta hydrolase [Candidatus Omnitrophota bacterium]
MMQKFRTRVVAFGILAFTLLAVSTAATFGTDTNKDGVLTAEEARANRREIRKERDRSEAEEGREPTLRDVRYGPYLRNLLDFYQARSDKPTPLLICFHGGGFVGGDKSHYANNELLKKCLESGISVVSANYRFIRPKDGEPGYPFPAPMLDGARTIQFVRSKAQEWNIDPPRVALTGGSAGACMSIWLAVHDDLTNPASEDPIEQQSTRVSCAIGYEGQTTLIPEEILKNIGGNPTIHPSLLPLYGVESMEDLKQPKIQELMHEATALNHVSRGDPPLYLKYGGKLAGTPLPPETSIGVSIHHAMFGKLMQDKYQALGLECTLSANDVPAEESEWEFLYRHMGLKAKEQSGQP